MFNESASSDEELFELLANPRRRLLLYHLFDQEGGVDLTDLSHRILAHETGVSPENVDEQKATSVYVSLYQTHIPALEEHDLVEYDEDERVVYRGSNVDDVIPLLQDSEPNQRRWGLYYLTAGVAFGSIVILSAVRLIPTRVTFLFTLAGIGVIVALAVSHYYKTQIDRPRESAVENLTG